MEEVELDAALRQRRRPIQRLLGMALVGLLVLVTISGVIVTVNPGVPGALGALLHGPPTPTATLEPTGGVAYFENGAPWGTLTIDNRTIPIGVKPNPLFLNPGRHTLTYRADPFPALRCTLTTPAAASDTCPLDAAAISRIGLTTITDTPVVDLRSTLDRLPAVQRDALVARIRSAVEYTSPVTTVRPSEHYGSVDSVGATPLETGAQPSTSHLSASLPDHDTPVKTASQPLNATMQIRVQNTNDGNLYFACAAVCLPPANSSMRPNPTAFPHLLELWTHVKIGYHYTTQDGSVVLDFAPLSLTHQASTWQPDSILPVYVGWNGTWQITPSGQDNAMLPCSGAQDDFRFHAVQSNNVDGARLAPNPTDGCVLFAYQMSGNASVGQPILYLERFGVLLAVGAAAHQMCPDLPMASQRETDEANALAAQGPGPWLP